MRQPSSPARPSARATSRAPGMPTGRAFTRLGRGSHPADETSCGCPRPLSGRNLVVCIDGTSNQFSMNNTNVVELFSRLVKDVQQLAYYNSGIGTYVKDSHSWLSYVAWKQFLSHTVDMAIATNFQAKVLGAYQWLSENYEEGDQIFLFGFSRGAYQVRVIAGMIEKVGLVHKGCNEQIPFAYELYTTTTANEQRLRSREPDQICQKFKSTVSRDYVKVHFVGAWDTVSSIGILRGTSLPETTTGMKHVCFFRHALALDELRVKFLPEYVNGGEGPDAGHQGNIKEVWFAGSHSDIGGGNIPNLGLDHFGPSLRWMAYEAINSGLRLEPNGSKWSPLSPSPSMTWPWRFLEYVFPVRHLSYGDANSTVFSWHREKPRTVKKGQIIHESVFEEMEKAEAGYVPKADLSGLSTSWDRDLMEKMQLIEKDPYTNAANILEKLKAYDVSKGLNDADVHVLETFVKGGPSDAQSITDVPDAANLLIAALDSEFTELQSSQGALQGGAREPSPLQNAIIAALEAFTSPPSYAMNYFSDQFWSNLESLFPNRPHTWRKFRAIFTGFFALYVPPEDPLIGVLEIIRKTKAPSRYNLQRTTLVPEQAVAHVKATTEGSHVLLELTDERVKRYGFTLPTHSLPIDDLDRVVRVLSRMEHFYRELNWTNGDPELFTKIEVEFYELQENDDDELEPVGRNICTDSTIDIVVDENIPYGMKLVNRSQYDLYPYLFWFDNGELSIKDCYLSPALSNASYTQNVPLPMCREKVNGELTIGYGSGNDRSPFCFDLVNLEDGQHLDIGFFKLILSTKPIDLSYIPLSSHLETDRGLVQFQPKPWPPPDKWDAILIPVVQRRFPVARPLSS